MPQRRQAEKDSETNIFIPMDIGHFAATRLICRCSHKTVKNVLRSKCSLFYISNKLYVLKILVFKNNKISRTADHQHSLTRYLILSLLTLLSKFYFNNTPSLYTYVFNVRWIMYSCGLSASHRQSTVVDEHPLFSLVGLRAFISSALL